MENPCYDTKTKTDCPYRSTGCSSTCKLWIEYVKKRNQSYEEKRKLNQAAQDMSGHIARLHERLRRGSYKSCISHKER